MLPSICFTHWVVCIHPLFTIFLFFFSPFLFFCFELHLIIKRSHAGSLFNNEEQIKVALWRIWYFSHTFLSCSWRHWYKLLGTKWQHLRSCFRDFRASVMNTQDQKSSENCCFFSPFIQIGPVVLIRFGLPLNSTYRYKDSKLSLIHIWRCRRWP